MGELFCGAGGGVGLPDVFGAGFVGHEEEGFAVGGPHGPGVLGVGGDEELVAGVACEWA